MDSPSSDCLLISIAMGVYNCESTVGQAIESIINQTYKNWEFIICDDGSRDCTLEIIENYAARDARIIVIKNPKNLGLNLTLNRCLAAANGSYIARMDGDDISMPHRLSRLVDAAKNYPDLAIISSWMDSFNENGIGMTIKAKLWPTKNDFVHGSPFSHPASIMRREALLAMGGYGTDKALRRAQDYDLWFRLYAAGYRGMNIPEVLYKFRDDGAAARRRNFSARLSEAKVMWRGFRMLGIPFWQYPMIFRPLILGLLPSWLYIYLRKLKRAKD